MYIKLQHMYVKLLHNFVFFNIHILCIIIYCYRYSLREFLFALSNTTRLPEENTGKFLNTYKILCTNTKYYVLMYARAHTRTHA